MEINGLSIGEICAILERHGMHCEAGPISHDAFRKFPFKKHFLIVVMRGNRNHFEVILDGTDDKVLLGMHGKDSVKWVQRDALWGEMDGPAIVVDKNRRWAALDSYSLVVLGGTIMLLPIIRAVYIRFRPTRKTSV